MSILNKVLKDLDKRGQKPGEAERSGGSAVAGPPARTPWIMAFAAIVLAVIAVIASYVSWEYLADNSRSMDAKPQSVKPSEPTQPSQVAQDINFARPVATKTQPDTEARLSENTQQSSSRQDDVNETEPAQQRPSLVSVPVPSQQHSAAPESTEAQQVQQQEPSKPAATLVKKVVKLSPQELIAREISAAQEAAEQGLLSESAVHWQKALTIDPNHIEVRRQLAALQFGRNKWQDALQVLTKGLELNPKAHELRVLAAKMLQKREQPQLALTLLQQAQPQVEGYLEYYQLKAQLAQQLSQWQAMAQSYQALAQAQPTQGRWWLGHGIASQQLGEIDTAVNAFKRAKTLIQHAPTLDFIEQQLNLLVEQDEATSS